MIPVVRRPCNRPHFESIGIDIEIEAETAAIGQVVEFALAEHGNRLLANDLSKRLKEWTGQTWLVAIVNAEGSATLREQAMAARDKRENDAANHPAVRAVMERFPGARIVDVRDPRAAEAEASATATGGDEDLPEFEPLFDDSEPDFDGIEFLTDN